MPLGKWIGKSQTENIQKICDKGLLSDCIKNTYKSIVKGQSNQKCLKDLNRTLYKKRYTNDQ